MIVEFSNDKEIEMLYVVLICFSCLLLFRILEKVLKYGVNRIFYGKRITQRSETSSNATASITSNDTVSKEIVTNSNQIVALPENFQELDDITKIRYTMLYAMDSATANMIPLFQMFLDSDQKTNKPISNDRVEEIKE